MKDEICKGIPAEVTATIRRKEQMHQQQKPGRKKNLITSADVSPTTESVQRAAEGLAGH